MGTCVSVPTRTGNDGVGRSNSIPPMASNADFEPTLQSSSCYWVYARFSDRQKFVAQCFYVLDIKNRTYLRLPDHPMNTYYDHASSVLDYNLYTIGGKQGQFLSRSVYLFEPALHHWNDTNPSAVARRPALAASANGRVYVFGGYDVEIGDWAEAYDPSTKTWAAIPVSQALIDALDSGLAPIRASAVLGNRIILRGSRNGIIFDVMSNSWIPIPENLIKGWWNCTRAAVVQNMLITCHCQYGLHGVFELSIRAYDLDQDVWLRIEGIDRSFHENASRSQFMSVNGMLVIYHMWEMNDLQYSIIEINERLETTVRATLLSQTQFPISKMIMKGLKIDRRLLRKSVLEPSLLEALREEALKTRDL